MLGRPHQTTRAPMSPSWRSTIRCGTSQPKRQKGTSLLKLASWSIHHGTAFKTLIDDISGLLDDLEVLFPAPESRKALAKEEVANVKDSQEVQALASASAGLDDVLYEEVSNVAGHQYKNMEVEAGKDATIVDGNVFA